MCIFSTRITWTEVFKKIYRMTQRDGMGREVGGGFRIGNTFIPVADSY